MTDAIIDTNVVIVASLAYSGAAEESHRTPEECEQVFEWLDEFRQGASCIILDKFMHIYQEYQNKLSGQDFGLMVINEKMGKWKIRTHEIEHEDEHDKAAIVPEAFAALDRSDRKFLAVALADLDEGHESEIVNATDTDDWRLIEAPAREHGVGIRHLLDDE